MKCGCLHYRNEIQSIENDVRKIAGSGKETGGERGKTMGNGVLTIEHHVVIRDKGTEPAAVKGD